MGSQRRGAGGAHVGVCICPARCQAHTSLPLLVFVFLLDVTRRSEATFRASAALREEDGMASAFYYHGGCGRLVTGAIPGLYMRQMDRFLGLRRRLLSGPRERAAKQSGVWMRFWKQGPWQPNTHSGCVGPIDLNTWAKWA